MARKSPQRPSAKEPKASADKVAPDLDATGAGSASSADAVAEPTDDAAEAVSGTGASAGTSAEESAEASDAAAENTTEDSDAAVDRSLWTDTRVDPVEIALPAGVGYTLRAYRLSSALAPTDVEGREEDEDPFAVQADEAELDDDEVVILDEEFAALMAEDERDEDGAKTGKRDADAEDADAERADAAGADATDGTATDGAAKDEHDDEDDHDDEEAASAEEVPFFLSHRGRLLLFKSPESLVAFVRSGAPHDLAQLDTWSDLTSRIEPADVAAAEDDSYELDLVVENLRGGHDTWDLDLLIRAGEIARDVGYALRLPAVMAALSPGSPLDDLDEALRAAAGGGISGFMGRRRLRRIGAQQASLGWRTIIGKISAAVDWRD